MKTKTLLLLGCALAVPAFAFAASSTAAMFAKMDRNHDGRVSAGEHAAGARAMFEAMDANHDGRVTAGEMTAAQPQVAGKAKPQSGDMSSADKIKVVDTNGDGVLSAEEHVAGSKLMFDKMDRNHDGQLTRGEFTAGHKQLMKK